MGARDGTRAQEDHGDAAVVDTREWRAYRQLLGKTQAEMGELVGLGREQVALIESGKRRPRPNTVKLLLQRLQESPYREKIEQARRRLEAIFSTQDVAQIPTPTIHCRECGILIGPDHEEKTARDGLCSSCWKEEHRQ